jgi:polyphosphate kinase 2 (PPK2 family)
MKMYEDCFENCNDIPWIIVPSDQNWYKEYVIASTLKDALESFKMEYPGMKK